jgi:molybdopterin-guanine dinucleotide biosynthesis protein A
MGGAKPELEVAGVPLLARVTAALTSVDTVVVVGLHRARGPGPTVVVPRGAAGAGPVAAVAAGMGYVRAPVVLLLGADLPFPHRRTRWRHSCSLAGMPTGPWRWTAPGASSRC